MKIKYIGTKALKRDVVAGTGIEWHGNGDVQEVQDATAAAKLLAFVDIWRQEVADKSDAPRLPVAPQTSATATGLGRPLLFDRDDNEIALDDMADAELMAFARTHEIPVDGRLKGDRLRAAIRAALDKE